MTGGPAALAAAGLAVATGSAWAQSLVVGAGNSPYTPPADATYAGISVGDVNAGVLTQPGHNLASTGLVLVGNASTGVGTYNLSGTASLTASTAGGGLIVGNAGAGTLNAFNASSVNTGVNSMSVANASGGTGTVNLGDAAVITAGGLAVGLSGGGTLNQTGGTFNSYDGTNFDAVYVGYNGGATGTYTLANGGLACGNLIVGSSGTGTFNQAGGTVSSNSLAIIGFNFGGRGTMAIANGSDTFAAGMYVGYSGAGTFNQTGGSVNTGSGSLFLGVYANSRGTALISGGTYQTSGAYVGYGGAGVLSMTGGALNAATTYRTAFGFQAGSTGTVNLSGGTISTLFTVVGFDGTGIVNQTGGTFTTLVPTGQYTLTLAQEGSSVGVYNLGGGTLSTLQVGMGTGASGTFNFNGGSLQSSFDNPTFMQGLTAANVMAGGATFNTVNGSITVAQPLRHDPTAGAPATDGGLTKLGNGVLALTGPNAYTGRTLVSGGELRVNNAAGSGTGTGNVTVAYGAELGGSGTVAGTVTIAAGGFIAAGSDDYTIGTFTTGAQSWTGNASNGGYVLNFNGSSADHLVMSGLTIAATVANPFTVYAFNGSGGATFTRGQQVVIATDTVKTGANPFATAIATGGLRFDAADSTVSASTGDTLSLTSGSDAGGFELFLTDVAAPEPTSLLLAGLAAAPLVFGRRRRQT